MNTVLNEIEDSAISIAREVLLAKKRREDPEILLALRGRIDGGGCADLDDVLKIIQQNEYLCKTLLISMRSVRFATRSKFTDIKDIGIQLGTESLYDLVIFTLLKIELGNNSIDINAILDDCHLVGQVARQLARQIPDCNGRDAFTVGLFHDCGVILMDSYFKEYEPFKADALSRYLYDTSAENEAFGCDHCLVGVLFAELWKQRTVVAETIYIHHTAELLESVGDEVRRLWGLLCFAKHCIHSCVEGHQRFLDYRVTQNPALFSRIGAILNVGESDLDEIGGEMLELLKLRNQSF